MARTDTESSQRSIPTSTNIDNLELVLYGRPDCCLCDRLDALISEQLPNLGNRTSITLTKRNVDDDDHWRSLYGNRIPVLTHGQHVILEGKPDAGNVAIALAELGRPANR